MKPDPELKELSSQRFYSFAFGIGVKPFQLAVVILALASAAWAAEVPDCHLVAGWEQQGPARSFTSDNLFEYMDGNAEGYLVYGFIRMQGVTCKSGGDSLVIDVSEMADEDAAYGIFASNRDPDRPIAALGMGGQVMPRRASFCKGKYYVELAPHPDKDHTPALQAFVAEMEKRISGRSAPPDALAWFPPDKLTAVRLIPQSVWGLSLLKRGYVAQYELGKAFVVAEVSPESASDVLKKLRERFGQSVAAQVADEAFQTNDQYLGGLCIFRKGRYLGGFANLPEGKDAAALAISLAARIP